LYPHAQKRYPIKVGPPRADNKKYFRRKTQMTAQEKKVVENKISELKQELSEVHGSKCEVYSRVVGYLRPVQNWNKGKKEEFALRKTMHVGCGCDK